MGFREFKADLAIAQKATFPGVSDLRRGDSDGEFAFTLAYENFPRPLGIQALAQDVTSYPKRPSFLLFTTTEDVDKSFVEALERLPTKLNEKSVVEIIQAICDKLISISSGDVSEATDDQDASDAEDWNDEFQESDYDLDLGASHTQRRIAQISINTEDAAIAIQRQKKDLRLTMTSGFSVGIFDPYAQADRLGSIYSLSIPVKDLGLTEETLEAWDVESSDHFVLLARFPYNYPSVSTFCSLLTNQHVAQFRIGRCRKAKPSLASVRKIFIPERNNAAAEGECTPQHLHQGSTEDNIGTDQEDLLPLSLFDSIADVLNKDLPRLLALRRQHKCSWDQAQAFLDERKGIHMNLQEKESEESALPSVAQRSADIISSKDKPWVLRQDHALAEADYLSIPLIAMEYALYRLVRCGQYCVNCHKKMKDGHESIKPYVCSEALCQDQYFSLGLGPGIEHEILTNTYVVDLLISFFYASLQPGTTRERPKGLGVKVMNTKWNPIPVPNQYISGSVCPRSLDFRSKELIDAPKSMFARGASVLILNFGTDGLSAKAHVPLPLHSTGHVKYLCRIMSRTDDSFVFEVQSSLPATAPLQVVETGWEHVKVYPLCHFLDDLADADQITALRLLTQTIPSVLQIRQRLVEEPGCRLAKLKMMDSTTYRLLHWIIASNRSFIVQDDAVPNSNGQTRTVKTGELVKQPSSKTCSTRIHGLGPEWMQFRFVQGSPEKEQLFIKEALSAMANHGQGETLPTLFAWHGSSLENWHSIIRQGLNYERTLHGRAYGDGVYFSHDLQVSRGYTLRGSTQGTWPNSELCISTAMSLCELVNQPQQFVSRTPYYVVKNTAWIQCRYLLVATSPTAAALNNPFPHQRVRKSSTQGCVAQPPGYQLAGGIGIPWSGIPESRKLAFYASPAQTGSSAIRHTGKPRNQSHHSVGHDLDGLLDIDDIEAQLSCPSAKRRRSVSEDTPRKRSSEQHRLKTPDTNRDAGFEPGALDWDSLPKLPAPSWASSNTGLKRLQQEVKALQKTQISSSLATLGWYINFDKLENLFHWIVEFHSFDENLPLAQDMKAQGVKSIVLELRFGSNFPMTPPFVRVVRPRFLPFSSGGGGHVTAGGAICSELLTNSGWTIACSLEPVFQQVRLGLCDTERPARLEKGGPHNLDYGIGEAVDAYERSARMHGWAVSTDIADFRKHWGA